MGYHHAGATPGHIRAAPIVCFHVEPTPDHIVRFHIRAAYPSPHTNHNTTMKSLKTFLSIWGKSLRVLDAKQRRRLLLLTLILLAETGLELLGVVSVYPFIALVLDPGMIGRSAPLSFLYRVSGCKSDGAFFALVAALIIALYVAKNAVNAAASWLRYGFVFRTKRELGVRLMRGYMAEPYEFFLEHGSPVLMRGVTNDVSVFFDMVLQCLYFVSDGLLIAALGACLLWTDPALASVCLAVMALFVLVFVRWNKRRAAWYGSRAQESAGGMTMWLQQAFGGIKEIKILGREEHFIHGYEKYCAESNAMSRGFSFLNQIPHMVLECMSTSAILLVILIRVLRGEEAASFIPGMAVFAMALFRIFPRVSRLNMSLNTMIFSYPCLDALHGDLALIRGHTAGNQEDVRAGTAEGSLTFSSDVRLEGVSYSYPRAGGEVLSKVSLSIAKGQSVGLVGLSGAGKSTLADLLLGILEPTSGRVLCDGKDIRLHRAEWSSRLGYIPQSIFLSDDTIRGNVAFGLGAGPEVDDRVWAALEQARLADFVRSLPDGLDTMVGERGARLSGGQRQRIGIARALYNNPELLVLDEATSALDGGTEAAVMESVEGLRGRKTLVVIAHRLTTVRGCDVIYRVGGGGVEQVSYADLLRESGLHEGA